MLLHGDSLHVLKDLEPNSVDSIVTDPPYGLKFMGKRWDYDVPTVELWVEVLRVLKPGGHLLSFGGTRTYHRMVVAIEDAGFEIRDQIQWLYGSGFPKSHNISKGIDKKFGAERKKGFRPIAFADSDCWGVPNSSGKNIKTNKDIYNDRKSMESKPGMIETDYASTDLAKQWDGYGTALKPANEPIVLARKPLSEKTIVDNVLKWGTGGLNIDGCRIETEHKKVRISSGKIYGGNSLLESKTENTSSRDGDIKGRFPANLILDEAAAEMLDEQSGECKVTGRPNSKKTKAGSFGGGGNKEINNQYIDKGGASRFFYCAKASKSERNAGLEGMDKSVRATTTGATRPNKPARIGADPHKKTEATQNHHPTVKPIKLMQYLIRLITPPNGLVLDPFMGTGTTGLACKSEGFDFIGIELNKEYLDIAEKRIV